MFRKLAENKAHPAFTVIAVLQTIVCVVWLCLNPPEMWMPMYFQRLVFTALVMAWACYDLKLPPVTVLYVLSCPFIQLIITGSAGVWCMCGLSVFAVSLLYKLYSIKKPLIFVPVMIVVAVLAVIGEKLFVFDPSSAAKMTPAYLLFEKTAWPHFHAYGLGFGPRFLSEYAGLVDEADLNPLMIRRELAPLLKEMYGADTQRYFLQASVYAMSIGTRTFIGEFIVRILLWIFAPFSFAVVNLFQTGDTYVAENMLDLAGTAPGAAGIYLFVFYGSFLFLIIGTAVRTIMAKGLKKLFKAYAGFIGVIVPIALFLWFMRLPCFDIRDAGLITTLHLCFVAWAFNRSDGIV
ncbi:MAG: hypothetical protein K6E19_03540 [Lachnospiraceae bacterium]|nr:hypothetical protein [Lachnospiraceae bacterium]